MGLSWWFDDLILGLSHTYGRAEVRAEDIADFAARFGPYMPLRPGAEVSTPVIGPAAPQALVYGLWTRMVYEETQGWPVRARLGQDALRWYATAHAGDVLTVHMTVVAVEDIATDHGLLIAEHEVRNADEMPVLSLMTRTLMHKKA
jgi:acyl dehydratase